MKKIYYILFTCVMCLTLVACGSDKKSGYIRGNATQSAYITGVGEGGLLANVATELDLGNKFEKRTDAPETLEINFNGRTIHGSYDETSRSSLYNCDFDKYKGVDENGTEYAICKNISNGEIVGYICFQKETDEVANNKAFTYDEFLSAAQEYLAQYADGDYRLANYEERLKGERGTTHDFTFQRYISGYPTGDGVTIGLDSEGEMYFLLKGGSPSFYETQSLDIDMDACRNAALARANELFGESIPFEITSECVTRLKDGRYGVSFQVDYDVYNENDSDDLLYSSTIRLFVYA